MSSKMVPMVVLSYMSILLIAGYSMGKGFMAMLIFFCKS